MFGITDLSSYLIGVIVIIILPGPNSLYCLTATIAQGKWAGVKAMLGIIIGDSLLIIATVLGAGTVLRMYPEIFHGLKLLGGAYLAYLGLRLLSAGYQGFSMRHQAFKEARQLRELSQANPSQSDRTNTTDQAHPFYRALSLSLTNPKAILFFLSFFVQFADPNYPHPLVTFLALALILQAVSFCYLSLLIIGGVHIAGRLSHYVWPKILGNFLVGALFVAFGVKLWLSQL